MSIRKKPHCRMCGAPMAGHKRQSGVPICSSPPTPPASPARPPPSLLPDFTPPSPHPSPQIAPFDLEEIVIPKYGIWRRPNPHWPDPPRPSTPSAAGSLVPTVLDDDADTKTGRATDDDDQFSDAGSIGSCSSQSSGALIESVLRHSEPLASLFRTPQADIPRVRAAADRVGLHFGSLGADAREESWWIAMGRSAEAVAHLLALEQKRMPGVFAPAPEEVVDAKPRSVVLGFFQLALAGAIGGLVVVRGLSLL